VAALLLALAAGSVAGAAVRPVAHITSRPGKTIATHREKAKTTFRFRATPRAAASAFECSIDGRPYRGCRSPKAYWLRAGRHVFRVRAVGAEGSSGPPATASFRVKSV
jgi:hypothetical protein